jgi:hypothetical protein
MVVVACVLHQEISHGDGGGGLCFAPRDQPWWGWGATCGCTIAFFLPFLPKMGVATNRDKTQKLQKSQ